MDVSVVVPAYEEADALGDTLDSLSADDEVIVVGGGDDGTLALARSHPIVDATIVDESGAGPARARNLGAEAAGGEVVAFTDADTVVPEDWTDRHVRHYADPGVVGVGGPLRPRSDDWRHRALFRVLSDYWYRVSWPVGFVQVSGNNASYRRETFLAAGGFDEDIGFMEDTELSLRMRHRGSVVYDRDCWVATSVRRQRDTGYVRLFVQYARAYANYYLLGRDPGDGYF